MATHTRSAGYCIQCKRGVTVVRPTGNGFFGRIRCTLTNNEDSWVCIKCGNPATKGFTPPADESVQEKVLSPVETQDMDSDPPAHQPTHGIKTERNDPAINNPESLTIANSPVENEPPMSADEAVIKLKDDPARPAISKALCSLCKFEITYLKKLAGKEVKCPSCNTGFQLP
jgi:hypothetical protein